MASDQDDRPGAGDATVVGDRGGDVMGSQRRRRSRCDAAGEQPGGTAGGACGAAAGDGTHAAAAAELLPARRAADPGRVTARATAAAGAVSARALADRTAGRTAPAPC